MKDLEVGNLPPTTSSVTLDGNEVFFWYKKIDEVILNRVKMEVQRRGSTFFGGGTTKLMFSLGVTMELAVSELLLN